MIKVKRLLFCLILIFGIVTGSFIDDTPVRADNRVSTVYNGVDYSPVYDFDYYVSKYEDVRRVFNGDPTKTFWHFINYGMREGRQAKADFNVGAYKNRYTDLQIAYGNNLPMYYKHYCIWGKREGRSGSELDYSKVFDAHYYADRYADLKAAFGYDETRLLNHYLKYGINEGRSANSIFGVNVYKSIYKDLQVAYGNNNAAYVEHYIKWGYRENRVANADYYSPIFNARYYADKYPDLKTAFGYDEIRLFSHFINYGMREGRQASADFNQHIYKKNYEDLRNAFGDDNTKYYVHYLKYGIREKRNSTSLIKKDEPTPPTPTCSHNWAWKTHTETIHHDAVTHEETYLIGDAWDEAVYVTKVKCFVCGTYYESTPDYHANDTCGGSYGHEDVIDHYIHHDAEYGTDIVIDTPAYDEYVEVKDYQYCSKCGEKK